MRKMVCRTTDCAFVRIAHYFWLTRCFLFCTPHRIGVVHVVDSVFLPPFLQQTLFTVLDNENGYFSAFVHLITSAGFESMLTDITSEYTLLAPINQAVVAFQDSNKTNAWDTNRLKQFLSYHVIVGMYPTALLQNQMQLKTLAGIDISVHTSKEGEFRFNNHALLIGADAGVAGNGLIHVVGSVLLLPGNSLTQIAAQDPDLSTLVTLLERNNLTSSNDNYTLFGPTNAAFHDLASFLWTENWTSHLRGILYFHVLPFAAMSDVLTNGLELSAVLGEDLVVTRKKNVTSLSGAAMSSSGTFSTVIQADIVADNGVLHKVDAILIPMFMIETLMDVVSGKAELDRLLDLIVFAGIEAEIVKMNRTLLAPINDAFADFNETEDAEAVERVLLYHLITDVYPAFMAESGLITIETVLGPSLQVTFVKGHMFIQGTKVLDADHLAGNGILHVVEKVLLPPLAVPPTLLPSITPIEPTTSAAPTQDPLSPPSRNVTSDASSPGRILYRLLALMAIFSCMRY